MNDTSLTVVEQREVNFYGDELTAVRAADGHIYVSIRHLCDALGLDRAAQVRRINRQEILHDAYKGGAILTPPSQKGVGGGTQQLGLIRVDVVPLFLTGISLKSVRDEIRPKLERFQREAAKVLWEAFQAGRLTADVDFDALLAQDSPEAQAYKMAQAVLQLARNQLLMRAQLVDHEHRLETIEAQLGDTGRNVTPDQASQVSQAVKAVALALGKKTGRNEFGAVYGELYRKFGITGYKMLPARRFDEAMKFLTDWHENLIGTLPF
ncbi:MAG: ORF6C domain-containing protein [Anaerolineales bacterium]|uniref:phage antirepressor N-terminal domain-containing protein n=1 Tax=Promineifilum sp. TaxID=2664178 RepID=UPI001D49EA1D|nr:ORF6C domain-containing protein [Anaerolineales bacterium]MCB8934844.1 ORF6C domain-containing protein [Promineifilum sp.]MCO5181262.1 ORF6C domain-containing protein [Promineifilum sp.]